MSRGTMVRCVGFLSLVLTVTACSSSSGPGRDGGDGGLPDGGDAEVIPDGGDEVGPPDGGSDAESRDGGGCDEAAHDTVLGTARLGGMYKVIGSAALPVTPGTRH